MMVYFVKSFFELVSCKLTVLPQLKKIYNNYASLINDCVSTVSTPLMPFYSQSR